MEKNIGAKAENKRLSLSGVDSVHTTEVSGELTMPDYYPEIKKVVALFADAIPDSKYFSESSLETGGSLAFNLLYIGDDGALTSVPYVTEYSQSINLGDGFQGSASDVRVESVAEGETCRPLAPRTVSMRAKVKTRVTADKQGGCTTKISLPENSPPSDLPEDTLEHLYGSIPTSKRRQSFATGSVKGEMSNPENARPVLCKGEILPDSTVPSKDSLTVKGTFLMTCLVLTGDGVYKTVTASLPIEEHLSAEGAHADSVCGFTAKAASVSVFADKDSQKLVFDGEYDIEAVYAHSEEVQCTEDVYSTKYALDVQRKDLEVLNLLCLENKTINVSGDGRRKSKKGENDYIIYHTAETKIERADLKDSSVCFSGSCCVKVLIASDGDVLTEELTIPVKFESSISKSSASKCILWHAHAYAGKGECRLEDTRIVFSCPFAVYAEAVQKTKVSPVTAITFGQKDNDCEDSSVIHICYPEKGRRIWDIAKECRAKVSGCERTNKVSRNDISDGTPIIVI